MAICSFRRLSLNGCASVCREVHSDTCTVLLYDIQTQDCFITQPVQLERYITNTTDCNLLDVYRRHRKICKTQSFLNTQTTLYMYMSHVMIDSYMIIL